MRMANTFTKQRSLSCHFDVMSIMRTYPVTITIKTAQHIQEKLMACCAGHVVREKRIRERPAQAYLEDSMH